MTVTEILRTDTNEMLDVRQVRDEVDRLDGAASDPQWLQADLDRRKIELLERHNEHLAAELAEMRRLHPDPLGERPGWLPTVAQRPATHWSQVRSAADLTEQQRHTAMIPPTVAELRDGDEHYAGAPIAAEIMAGVDCTSGWPVWLDEVHRADAEWADALAGLRAWPDTHHADVSVWDDELAALCEPVVTDWWERDNRLMVGLMTRDPAEQHPAAELAPERLDAEAEQRQHKPPRTSGVLAAAAAGVRHDQPNRPHRSWWRRHTLDLTMTAGLAVVAAVVAVMAGVL